MTTAIAEQQPKKKDLLVPRTKEDLTGRQKVAVLCMSLGASVASQLTKGMSNDEVEEITFEIARLTHVSAEVVEGVWMEWLETAKAMETVAEGGVDYAREVLEQAFGPQRAAAMLKRIQSQLADTVGLQRLRNVDPQQLGTMLRGEHPQTIALVLAHLQPAQTVEVLNTLDPQLGGEVVYRMARMEKVSPEMLQLIERTLSSETDLAMSQGMMASGGPAAVAEVLNLTAGSLEKQLLEGIGTRDPELCQAIKDLMFVFEDLVRLDERSMQRVLRDIDSKELALALKATSSELKNRLTSVMSKRAVEALEEEMEYLGAVRLRDVETAQSAIVRKVRELEEAGEIVIATGADDEFVE